MRTAFKPHFVVVLLLASTSEARAGGRNLDLELNYLTGIPDLMGFCLEEHWTDPWAIEACAGTAFLASTFSSHAKRNSQVSENWALGWGFGLRSFNDYGCFDTCGDGSLYAAGPEALLSAEWSPGVQQRGWGFTLEFDLGAGAYIPVGAGAYVDRFPMYPWGRISFGLAF